MNLNPNQWRPRTQLAAGVVVFAVAAVAVSGGSSEPAATPTPAAATSSSGLAARLVKIDARMADNPERYEDRAKNTCAMLKANDWTQAKYEATTVERFRGGTMPDFTQAQARQVIAAVKATICS